MPVISHIRVPPPPKVSAPIINPDSGSFVTSVEVSMSTTTSGASIYYTTNGSLPSASSTLYSAPFTITAPFDGVVRAIAIKAGLKNSGVVGESYVVTAAPPASTSWDVNAVRELPWDVSVFSDWPGPPITTPYRIVGSGDGTGAPTHSTLASAVAAVSPGEAILVREGFYWEEFKCLVSGTSLLPIIISSYPGEVATFISNGIQEFYDDPLNAWEGVVGGATDEFESVNTYPSLSSRTLWFAESMVPIQLTNPTTFVAESEVAPLGPKDTVGGYYIGPCTRFDTGDDKWKIRLTHTDLKFLRDNDFWGLGDVDYNYTGETDPRNIPLFVTNRVTNPNNGILGDYVIVRDLVVIGGGGDASFDIRGRSGIQLINTWQYPTNNALDAGNCPGIIVERNKIRGICAPWTSRAAQKYHGSPTYNAIFNSCPGAKVTRNEFTEGHDLVRFDNNSGDYEYSFNLQAHGHDDGLFMPGKQPSGIRRIFGNIFSGTVSTFPTTGGGFGVIENDDLVGTYIYRNLIDRTIGAYGGPPRDSVDDMELWYGGSIDPDRFGEMFMGHGSHERARVRMYHNTIIATSAGGSYYFRNAGGNPDNTETTVQNNIFVLISGLPREDIQSTSEPYEFNRGFNVVYSLSNPGFVGVVADEIYGDPKFVFHSGIRHDPNRDLRLQLGSPAIDAGTAIPEEWPDIEELRAMGADCGAIPSGYNGVVFGPDSELS